MNAVTVIGYVDKVAHVSRYDRRDGGETMKATFRVVTWRVSGWDREKRAPKYSSTLFRVVAWKDLALACQKLGEGDRVMIVGRQEFASRPDEKTGQIVKYFDLVADDVAVCVTPRPTHRDGDPGPKAKEGSSRDASPAPRAQPVPADIDEEEDGDVPF